MIRTTYSRIRRELVREGAFRIHNLHGVLTTVSEIVFFGFGLAMLLQVTPFALWYWLLQLVMGTSLYRMFVILHECGHKTLFRNKAVNTLVGSIVSPICLLPYIPWRDVHFQHHKWVGVIDKDPTQAELLKLHRLSPIQRLLFRVFWKLCIPVPMMKFVVECFWLYPMKYISQGSPGRFWKSAISVFIAGAPHVMLLMLFGPIRYLTVAGPMIVVYFAIFELVNLAQHSGMFPYLSTDHPSAIPLREQDEITRSTKVPRWLSVVLFYNFNLHTEHHLYPMIPWYSLPLVSEKINDGECTYHEVGMIHFAAKLRSADPIDIYVNALPKTAASKEKLEPTGNANSSREVETC